MNIETKVRGLVLIGVFPRFADGKVRGHDLLRDGSFSIECAVQAALAVAAQLRTTVYKRSLCVALTFNHTPYSIVCPVLSILYVQEDILMILATWSLPYIHAYLIRAYM
jgi:hypothetical protein